MRTEEEKNLRQWLHRIEEACAGGQEAVSAKAIREAALAALRCRPAPKIGLEQDKL